MLQTPLGNNILYNFDLAIVSSVRLIENELFRMYLYVHFQVVFFTGAWDTLTQQARSQKFPRGRGIWIYELDFKSHNLNRALTLTVLIWF